MWNTIPVALSLGDGRFTITNNDAGWFGAWASTPNVKALTGDFNHDGHTDIALVGGANWSAIPIAFAAGNGTWTITNNQSPDFAWWAGRPNVRALTGDFNKDGFTDIALTGAAGWLTVPVAFSYGNGNFLVTNRTVCIPLITFPNGSWIPGPNFATLASAPGAQVVTGDFNKDGYADLALAGGAGWDTIPMAFSYGDGTFAMYAKPSVNFPVWATTPGATLLTGDFNGDGYTDLALTGAAGWNTVPLAINIGFGSFAIINSAVGAFGSQSATAGARAVTGDFNGDGHTDIALTGGAGFSSIPVAFSAGIGAFNVTNQAVTSFGAWSSDSAATTLAGRVN